MLCDTLDGQIHAVVHGRLVARGQRVRHRVSFHEVGLRLFVKRPDARTDDRADDTDKADEQVVQAEHVGQPDLFQHDQGECDGDR